MSIAHKLQDYLNQQAIQYDVLHHPYTETSMNAAGVAHIPAAEIAKPVILEDDMGYVMAVIPAHHHVKIGKINKLLGRHMGLATEVELEDLFSDCQPGAIPPVGQAYGMETVVDSCLGQCPDVYLEAGDHVDMIHLQADEYKRLMSQTIKAHII